MDGKNLLAHARLFALLNVAMMDGVTAVFDAKYSTGTVSRSTLWPPSKADVTTLLLERDAINIVTAGALSIDKSRFRWNVRVKVPVSQSGL